MANLKDFLKKVGDYFNPESNGGNNFWSTGLGSKALPAVERGLAASRYDLPKFNFQQYVPQVKTKIPLVNTVANLPLNLVTGVAEGVANAPVRAWETGARIGYDIPNAIRGNIKITPQRVLSDIAPGAVAALDVAGLGVGKQIAKQGFEMAARDNLLKSVVKGSGEGAAYGGSRNFFDVISSKDFANTGNFQPALMPTIEGAVGGGILGGALKGSSAAFGQLRNLFKKADPTLSEKELTNVTSKYLRDTAGRFAKQVTGIEDIQKPRFPSDLPKGQADLVQIRPGKYVESKYAGLYKKIDTQLGVPDDFRIKKIGLSTKLLSKAEHDANIAKGIVPDAQAGLSEVKPMTPVKDILANKTNDFEAQMNAEAAKPTNVIEPKPTQIDSTQNTLDQAVIRMESDNGNIDPGIKSDFAKWVNTRRASQVEGLLQSKQFEDLRSKGVQGIFEFQSGNKEGRFADVKNYFDTKYGQLQEKGIKFNYKEDYLTQIWQNPQDEVKQVFRNLSLKPGFSVDSLIKNYEEGIKAGLTPKYDNIPDLIRSYESATNKAIADRDFFDTLAKDSLVVPYNKAPRDWVSLNPDRFPRVTTTTDVGDKYTGVYKAPPELAKMINNYLGEPNASLEAIANWTSSVKNRVLSFGVPGTAINAHGFNILSRNIMASKNPIEGTITGIKYMLHPNSAEAYLDKTLAEAPEAIKNGLTLSTHEFKSALEAPKDFKTKFGEKWGNLFEIGLFDKMLPALKLQKYQEVRNGFIKGGMNEMEAGKNAAKFTNDVFGGINWEELGGSKDYQNLLRTTILAPDWLKTNINLGKNLTKSVFKIKDPTLAPYRRFLATFLGSYVTMNVVNKLSSGHWMFQNDPGNAFNIEAGYTEDGQKRFIRPYGTAADFLRIPVDVLNALRKGDLSVIARVVRNRLSIPLGVATGALTDTDYTGKTIGYRGTDKYGNPMPLKQRIAGVGGELATLAGLPAFAKQGIDFASGKTGGEQALLQAMELPFRYSGGAGPGKNAQFIKSVANNENVTGKDLYDLYEKTKGVTFSDNQKDTIRSGGLNTLPGIMQQKEVNKANNDVKKVGQDIVDGKITQEEGNKKIEEILQKIQNIESKPQADNSLVDTARASDSPKGVYTFQYKSPSGKVSIETVDLSKNIEEPKLTGNGQLDKSLMAAYKGEISSRITDIRKLYESGKITADQAEKLINETRGSGGSGRKAKIKVQSVKPVKITVKPYKPSQPKKFKNSVYKVKKFKPRNIKISNVGKVKVTKPKKFRNTLKVGVRLA